MDFDAIAHELLGMYHEVRYVAHEAAGILQMRVGEGAAERTAPGNSDRYEELLVNPTLVDLAARRSALDDDGLRYILLAYGKVFQIVVPVGDGHLSVAVDASADPRAIVGTIEQRLAKAFA